MRGEHQPGPFGNTDDPSALLALTVQLANASADDPDVLVWIAVDLAEALVDLYWPSILEQFDAAASASAAVRMVISSCDFDAAVPEDVVARLYARVGPGDDLGHRHG
jgi:hypothetical protein